MHTSTSSTSRSTCCRSTAGFTWASRRCEHSEKAWVRRESTAGHGGLTQEDLLLSQGLRPDFLLSLPRDLELLLPKVEVKTALEIIGERKRSRVAARLSSEPARRRQDGCRLLSATSAHVRFFPAPPSRSISEVEFHNWVLLPLRRYSRAYFVQVSDKDQPSSSKEDSSPCTYTSTRILDVWIPLENAYVRRCETASTSDRGRTKPNLYRRPLPFGPPQNNSCFKGPKRIMAA